MTFFAKQRRAFALAGAATLLLAAAACGDDNGGTAADPDSEECAPYVAYQGHDGTDVSIYASIRDTEADLLMDSWRTFEECTGITINYDGSGEFESQLPVRVQGGNAPDIAFIPQPGVVETFARDGNLFPVSAETRAMAEQNYSEDWLRYATVDGDLYGAPLGSNVKSFVWYSPSFFTEHGYTVPQTWDELITLSDQIASNQDIKPWCAGIESGVATGWPATDWVEDILLRDQPIEVYDQWVTHEIPFNDPRIASALDRAGTILKNDRYVNGGYGDVSSIATTSFQEAGLPILDGECALHRQASFYANQWPEGTNVAENGDVFAFYFPPVDPARGSPVLGGGEFVVAFADRPEVQMVQTFLASEEHANARASMGNWVSANRGLDVANVENPIDRLSVEILQDPETVFRFDGSDLMPSDVGAGTFWRGMVDWITGQSTEQVLNFIENSWN